MWFWRSGLGPGPSKPGAASKVRKTGATASIKTKKNPVTVSITTIAQPTSGSVRRLLNLAATATVKAVRRTPHNRIDPSSADHIVATSKGNGVVFEPSSATYFTDVSLVSSATCMTPTAPSAATSAKVDMGRAHRSSFSLPDRRPLSNAPMPTTQAANPSEMAAFPSRTDMWTEVCGRPAGQGCGTVVEEALRSASRSASFTRSLLASS